MKQRGIFPETIKKLLKMKNGSTYTTGYRTSKIEGSVKITRLENGYSAEFDNSKPVSVTIGFENEISFLVVNLKELFEAGFNCPAVNQNAKIKLHQIANRKEHMEMIKTFQDEVISGKICGDGIWRSYKELREMGYTKKVLIGEYTEE